MIDPPLTLIRRYSKLGSGSVVCFRASPLCGTKCVLPGTDQIADRVYQKKKKKVGSSQATMTVASGCRGDMVKPKNKKDRDNKCKLKNT